MEEAEIPVEDKPAERQNKKIKTQQKRDELTRQTVIQSLMQHREGRRYIWLELEVGNVFTITYVPDSFDRTAFREGQRQAALSLLNNVQKWSPRDYLTMTVENANVKLEGEDNE